MFVHVRKILCVLCLRIDIPEGLHTLLKCCRIGLRSAGRQLLKKVGQHVVRVMLEPLEVIGHAAISPLPAPQQLILPRPDCEHTVMLRRILTQVVDHGADSAAFSMPVRDFVIQRELLDKRPRPVQFLNRHTCTGRCPCVQKYIEFLVGHLGQVF